MLEITPAKKQGVPAHVTQFEPQELDVLEIQDAIQKTLEKDVEARNLVNAAAGLPLLAFPNEAMHYGEQVA